jgi:hypothetical protein
MGIAPHKAESERCWVSARTQTTSGKANIHIDPNTPKVIYYLVSRWNYQKSIYPIMAHGNIMVLESLEAAIS